jgi:thiosulfate/3-mercaptopyruvate sulfurtransferase
MMLRSALLAASALLMFAQQTDPWKDSDLMQPAALASAVKAPGAKPAVFFVGFPVLYKGAHIPGALNAGPADRGVEPLKQAVAKLDKNREIVLYCGCCPWKQCPNVRPAFRALKEMGYTKVKVLSIETNMNTDWVSKGYPTEKPAGTPAF